MPPVAMRLARFSTKFAVLTLNAVTVGPPKHRLNFSASGCCMELPRIASQTSICPPSIRLLTDFPRPREEDEQSTKTDKPSKGKKKASERVQAQVRIVEPQFAIIPTANAYRPSRRREEACALENLRKKFEAVRVLKANKAEPIEACANDNCNNLSPEELDNRPYLLQKILSSRPVSMVLDISEIRTAWQDSDFITDCLCWHNVYRQRHAAPPLSMCSELCYLAQTWANHLAHTNKFYYRNDKDIGQNLFCRPSNGLVQDISGQEVATYWYTSVKSYDYGKEPECLHANVNAGHFTQMVWSSTRFCGVGKARSRSGKIVVVAHYSPPGNTTGGYMENVQPPCEEFPRLPPAPPPRLVVASSTTSESSRSITGST